MTHSTVRPFALLALPFLLLTGCGPDSTSANDPSVKAMVSHEWGTEGQLYRVLQYNTEEKPCLTIQSMPKDESRVTSSENICTLIAGPDQYNLRQSASLTYSNLRWADKYFRIDVEYMPLSGVGALKFQCMVDGLESTAVLRCRKQK